MKQFAATQLRDFDMIFTPITFHSIPSWLRHHTSQCSKKRTKN